MPHIPFECKSLSRMNLDFVIPQNKIGILYQGEVHVGTLKAGQGLKLKQRMSPGSLRICLVDIAPHSVEWRVALPIKNDQDVFSVTIKLRYRVSQPQQMVDEQVNDTEVLAMQILEPELRRISRSFRLDQHQQADDALTNKMNTINLQELCGLQLLGNDVVIHLSQEQRQAIESFHLPLVSEHLENVPCKSPNDSFIITVNLTYRVEDPAQLPNGSPSQAEQQLWPRIRTALRRSAAKFELMDITDADKDMQSTLLRLAEEKRLDEFGLSIIDVQVSTNPDPNALRRYGELAELQHQAALEKVRLDGQQPSVNFYLDLIHKGSWAALAVAVSKGEVTTKELHETLSEDDKRRLDVQLEMMREYRNANIRDEKQDYETYKRLSDNVADDIVSKPLTKLNTQKPELPKPKQD